MPAPSGSPAPRGAAHHAVLAAALLAPGALIGVRLLTEPDPAGLGTHEQLGLAPCSFHASFDLPCPGCGVTTAFSQLAHGAPAASLATQPLGTFLGLVLLALPLLALARHRLGHDLADDLRRVRWAWLGLALAVVALLSWGYRLSLA